MTNYLRAINSAFNERLLVRKTANGKIFKKYDLPLDKVYINQDVDYIVNTSGEYSKNPIKKLISLYKQFKAIIKSPLNLSQRSWKYNFDKSNEILNKNKPNKVLKDATKEVKFL